MAFFQFKPSPLPENVHIYNSDNTPKIDTIKILLILSLIFDHITLFNTFSDFAYCSIKLAHLTFAGFAYFYLAKYSLRTRIFKIFILLAITMIAGGLLNIVFSDFPKEKLLQSWFLFIMPPLIQAYLFLLLYKELSLITHEPLFYTSAKLTLIDTIIMLITAGVFITKTKNTSLDYLGISFACFTLLALLAILIMHLVAIFRLKYIIAYGKNPQTNHS